MKHIITAALTIFSLAACSSNHGERRVSKSMSDGNQTVRIDDDSKTLSIKVKVKNAEKPIDYDKSFDVRNLSDKQKENLTNSVLDSPGIKI